jgi:undecaprenyl-diphosphatase
VNHYLLSVLFGIVEGLTEFLPVSSTAHLRITEALCGIKLDDPYWMMYSIVIQLGAILSVVVYFRDRIVKFLSTFPQGINGDRTWLDHPLTQVMVAFVCTAGPAFLLLKLIKQHLQSEWVMGASLLIGGVAMWMVDSVFTRPRTLEMEKMSLPQAIWIGIVQILSAVFPGTSRSMSTIAAGQTAGMSRAAALEFSFFLCIPTMFAATGKELYDTLKHGLSQSATAEQAAAVHLTGHQWGVLIVGFVVSFLVAWAVIAWFMHWVRKHGFVPFALYRIVLGIAILLWVHKQTA